MQYPTYLLTGNAPRRYALLVAFLIGAAFGGVYLRHSVWKSPNSGYAFSGDRLVHVAGANYFQQQPWQFPIFDIEGFRFPEGGSLIFTDGIPLVGFFIKLSHPLHGSLIDYFGWYYLLCFALQSLAFVLILRQCGIHHWAGVVTGSLFAVATPILLFRGGHIALCSHFLILLSLWLYLRSKSIQHSWNWYWQQFLLLVGALLVHPYIFVMVGVIFAASCLQALWDRRISIWPFTQRTIAALGGLLAIMLLSGHIRLDVKLNQQMGYGYHSMNLLSPIWPQRSGLAWWDTPVLNPNGGQYEGYAWLGGGLILLLLTLCLVRLDSVRRLPLKHPFIGVACLSLVALSVSNTIYAGPFKLLEVELPGILEALFGIFRASGRFFWPVTYTLLAAVLVLGWRRFSPRTALILVCTTLTVQLVDVSAYFTGPPNPSPRSPKLESRRDILMALLPYHERVVLLPDFQYASVSNFPKLLDIYLILSQQNLPVSSSYMARQFNPRSSAEDRELYLGDGFRDDTLYLFLPPTFPHVDAWSIDPSGEYIREMDDLLIVSRHIKELENVNPAARALLSTPRLPHYVVGTQLDLTDLSNHVLFSGLDQNDAWTIGKELRTIFIPDTTSRNLILYLRVTPFVSNEHPSQRVKVFCGDRLIEETTFSSGNPYPSNLEVVLPADCLDADGILDLRIELPDARSPKSLGHSSDHRVLGLFIHEFAILGDEAVPDLLWMERVSFARDEKGTRLLAQGFSDPEEMGTWTNDEMAILRFTYPSLDKSDGFRVELSANAFVVPEHPSLKCIISSEDQILHEETFTINEPSKKMTFRVNPTRGIVELQFKLDHPASPASLGLSTDARNLGLYLREISISPESVSLP